MSSAANYVHESNETRVVIDRVLGRRRSLASDLLECRIRSAPLPRELGNGQLMATVLRSAGVGDQSPPHVDSLAVALTRHLRLQCRVGVVLVLEPAAGGGVFRLWNVSASAVDQVDGNQGVDATIYGPPQIELAPRAGEAIVFNSQYLHAVSPIENGRRVSLAGFVGKDDRGEWWSFA